MGEEWDYEVEKVLDADGATVCSLVVRFTLPEGVTSAVSLELLLEPPPGAPGADAVPAQHEGGLHGFALVVKSADERGACSAVCPCARCVWHGLTCRARICAWSLPVFLHNL